MKIQLNIWKTLSKLGKIHFICLILLSTSCNTPKEKGISEEVSKKTYLDSLIARMSLEEKVSMVHGVQGKDPNGLDYVGYVPGIPRLNIPPLRFQNGPSGAGATFSSHRHLAPATAFPVPAAQASTWNEKLLYEVGQAIGLETKAQGRDMVLGPGVNIVRIPEGGRNFEYFSEDPYLSGRCGVAFVKGAQEMGTMTSVKHFAANSQETWRFTIDEQISNRALREIYLPAFEATVKEAKVSSVMAAYNKINGVYCTENKMLLTDILRNDWGYEGFVMTDWGTRHKTVSAANAGLGMEMSGWGKFGEVKFRDHLADAVKNGEVKEATLNKMVYYILSVMYQFGLLKQKKSFPEAKMDTPDHRALAYQVAVEGIVLLKNDNKTLPLDAKKLTKITLFGDAMTARASGAGSSNVVPFYSVSPYEGIKNHLKNTEVSFLKSVDEIPTTSSTEVGIVFVYRFSKEGDDRESISLDEETKLIEAVSKKFSKTIVVLRTAGAYTMPWIDKVDAVLQAWYPGQEEGNAEAGLLFGVENPSGKLPVTFGKSRDDYPATNEIDFPGINEKVNYSEGIFVGYRWFEKQNIKPLFAFGHGLSYTTFNYSNLVLEKSPPNKEEDVLKITFSIINTGDRDGAEVSQIYIGDDEASAIRPIKELKGFSKVFLKAGEKKTVEYTIKRRDLSFWDDDTNNWKVEPGKFKIMIGSSSEDIRLNHSFIY